MKKKHVIRDMKIADVMIKDGTVIIKHNGEGATSDEKCKRGLVELKNYNNLFYLKILTILYFIICL